MSNVNVFEILTAEDLARTAEEYSFHFVVVLKNSGKEISYTLPRCSKAEFETLSASVQEVVKVTEGMLDGTVTSGKINIGQWRISGAEIAAIQVTLRGYETVKEDT